MRLCEGGRCAWGAFGGHTRGRGGIWKSVRWLREEACEQSIHQRLSDALGGQFHLQP